MDFSVRRPILERRQPRPSFPWFNRTFLPEAEAVIEDSRDSSLSRDVRWGTYHPSDSTPSDSTLPENGSSGANITPGFSGTPLVWLSEKIFSKVERSNAETQGVGNPVVEEIIGYEEIPKSKVMVGGNNINVIDSDSNAASSRRSNSRDEQSKGGLTLGLASHYPHQRLVSP